LKAAIFRGVRKIDITDVPMPRPDANEVLIKVKYCGVRRSVGSYKTGTYEEGLEALASYSNVLEPRTL
jgi:D-arabinose 1-dehydrogenase-like Zn-dependent alcohol dehydrogenase